MCVIDNIDYLYIEKCMKANGKNWIDILCVIQYKFFFYKTLY